MTTSSEDRILVLVRHASALGSGPSGDDHSRPLSEQGRADAQELGRWLREHGYGCDEVLCSPAQRTRETMEEVGAAGCPEAEVQIEHRLYNGDSDDVLAVAREATPDASVVLVVGHAPGVPAAVSMLADGEGDDEAHDALTRGFAAGTAAVLSYRGHWSDLAYGSAVLEQVRHPAG
ncbi:hypothetical protein GCM10027055_19670 [Janibacter alkaliphilus]|uniref:Phosphohistidine phosphatase n=1 Tax=Janibacter alkaliphilus TaxID=1069963 RepID=A0A852X488_9MICO|nr:histidine phosphatase family protein [Janibacter alkaliphilus]NYG35583.1 phosphohistidine phosphatase [Janibacter alkaliphilus]